MNALLRLGLFALLLTGALVPMLSAAQPGAGHWAFAPPRRSEPPLVRESGWPRNSIDRFVLARLEAAALRPAAEASRETLIRRLSLDLLGLPPAPEAMADFVHDPRPDAYERLLDRLLASPHFGERWGRHWLDLARYADSDGYEKDGARPFAYYYRDWTIGALNRDVPFDQFTMEQIAGDLLVDPANLADRNAELLAATGFHRQTLTNKEGGADPEEDRVKQTVDRATTTATVWLGLTLGCAECHDHKYDPISQQEFYEFYAFFNSLVETNVPAPLPDELRMFEQARRQWEARRSELEAAVASASVDVGPSRTNQLAVARKALAEHSRKEPARPARHIAALTELPTPRKTRIHRRGDFLQLAGEVTPATLKVLNPLASAANPPGRRELAHWLTDPGNPLAARVAANRIWQHLFGFGLVRTPEDFGTRGDVPTHPELLDWLATELLRSGGSQKALIRLIASSAAYRQSSVHRADVAERDAENRLLARQNRVRLDAEIIRDSALAASGLLDARVGGPSVRPPLPADITDVAYAGAVQWPTSEGGDRYRRGLYTFLQRTVLYPMLTAFDAPDALTPCTRRERSNTPLQALSLLNDPTFFACASALGAPASRAASDMEAVTMIFSKALCRPPTDEERSRLLSFARSVAPLTGTEQNSVLARTAVARAVLNLEEFLTRE